MPTTDDARRLRRPALLDATVLAGLGLAGLVLAGLVLAVAAGGALRVLQTSLRTSEQPVERYHVRDDGRTLDVTSWSSRCSRSVGTRVAEAATTVEITVVEVASGDPCPAVVTETTRTVTLDHPLGARRVLSEGHRVDAG